MTVHSSGDQVDIILARLRAEQPLEADAAQQAVLHHEAGQLEEMQGDHDAAVREYAEAFETYPEYRESLESLVRVCRRNHGDENLPRLLTQLVESATTPEETARALWELAAHRQSTEQDLEGAIDCLQSAVENEPKAAACWLELELLAASQGDTHTQLRALEARAELTTDPTWQGLLLIELAKLCADNADLERASSLLDTVVASEGGAQFASRMALEAIAIRTEEPEMWAHALEGQAELIAQAIDDPEFGAKAGIPRFMCRPEHAAEAWLRAGELRRRSGDAWGAVAALSGAAERLGEDRLVARLRMAAADAAGDHAAALEIAKEQLTRGGEGALGASLWLRVGLAAAEQGETERALDAYGRALELDPTSAPALVMRIDALTSGEDAKALAETMEAAAAIAGSEAAQARAWLTVAQVWAVRAGDAARAQQALERASKLGTPPNLLARLARAFASICNDRGWYEQATQQMLELEITPPERASLWFEIGRDRMRRDDLKGAIEAFAMLGQGDEESEPDASSLWLGRCLAAYAVGMGSTQGGSSAQERAVAVRQLAQAEPDTELGRGLIVVAALLTARTGQSAESAALLREEHERDPSDVVLALYAADLLRREGDPNGAASVLSSCAGASGDPDLAAALELEAGFLVWSAGARQDAIGAFENALEHGPQAARQVLGWALRCVDPDDAEGRKRAIELAEETGGSPAAAALERFGLGVATAEGEPDARAALEQLDDVRPGGDLEMARLLARLIWSNQTSDRELLDAALEQLEEMGGVSQALARAERFRLARFEDRDGAAALRTATAWAAATPTLPTALEWLGVAVLVGERSAEADAKRAIAEHLQGEARAAVEASAAAASLVDQPALQQPFLNTDTATGRLMNLELAPPGSDPQRRAAALRGVDGALGLQADSTAEALAAWSDLAAGEIGQAQASFQSMVEERPEDIAAWEGLRDCSEQLGDYIQSGLAGARLGSLCRDDPRAAEFWELAGLTLLEHTEAKDDAEIAFERALDRDPSRFVAFDKLFRRVRARNEDDRLLDLIAGRLSVTEDSAEITKMYWERARVLRRKGDQEGALQCLKDVTILEPDHVGALALAGEIYITRGGFTEAAPLLARLSTLDEAPRQQRLVSGVAAADLFEKKLEKPDLALDVLSSLHRAGLSTAPVRERLARTAARVGQWEEATAILEQLMEERDSADGRAEAARLAMAIYRDKLRQSERAEQAVVRLLKEVPDDAEAVHLLLSGRLSDALRASAINRARETLVRKVVDNPFDVDRVQLLADIAAAEDQPAERRAALGGLVALGKDVTNNQATLATLAARTIQVPQIVLHDGAILEIADPADAGALAELFALLAQTISEALGPSLRTENVGRRQRIDEPGHPLRADVSRWMAALGFGADFQLYVGGSDERGVKGVADDEPAIVLGSAISAPLDAVARGAVAREVFALRRGTTSVLHYDDHTIASIAIAASNEAGVSVPEPPFAVYPEVSRAIRKALPRKVRKSIAEVCARIQQTRQDANAWAAAARRSIDRMALIASGDASIVIDDIVAPPDAPERRAMDSNERAQSLLSFALSPEYLALREKLGMGIE